MPNANLKSHHAAGKSRTIRCAALSFIVTVALFAACGSDNSNPVAVSLPAGFSLKGSYYLTQRSATSDGINYEYDSESSTGGVMLVMQEDTLVSATYDLYAYPFRRDYTFDGGTTTLSDSGYVLRSDLAVGLLYPGATDYAFIGDYDKDENWIKINYTENNVLYTETWKRVKPVTDIPNTDGGAPWVP